MPLAPSTRLGPYEILAPLGSGGMGEVYRARDPRMGREVAIKISAERFSDRFEREVHAAAALNHPNICHIYDVGPNYLVMELIEGPTLADRIRAGAVPLDEALAIAHQIADALEAAHEKGIVHRDLKPANIKLKPDGTVKVLDFGLAKIAEPIAPSGGPESSPTIPMGATVAGQIMGTAAYMSPEQARGKPVDKRADIWAFGVVLYEMLTGHRLFEGETISDTLAGVLTKQPEWDRVPAKTRGLLRRCLEKDPKRRLRDIGDAWALLEDTPPPSASGTRLPWALTGVMALALVIALWGPWRATLRPMDHPTLRLDVALGPEVSLGSSVGAGMALSPDGARLAFVSQGEDGVNRLFTRRLDQPKAAALARTEGAYAPFFSPDGQWVGFFARGKLKKMRLDAAEPVSLCDAPAARGASWADDGSIIAALGPQTALSQIPAAGGKPVPITVLSPGEISHRWPHFLPGGKAVLFNVSTDYAYHEGCGIAVVSLNDHRRKMLLDRAGMYPRFLSGGHLIYAARGLLFALPFDPDRLEVLGKATPLEEVATDPTLGSAQIDFSRTGTMAYRADAATRQRTVEWLDTAGRTEPVGGMEPAAYLFPRLSPDGARLALMLSQEASTDLWIYDLARGSRIRVTNGPTFNSYPVWSPDGRFLVFQSAGGMFWVSADGAGKPRPLTRSQALQLPSSFSPDGTRLVFSQLTPDGGAEIRILPVDSRSGELRAGESQLFLKTSTGDSFASISPDGRWVAYADAQGGTYEVHVRPLPGEVPGAGTHVQVSNAGGTMALWSRKGHELFYRTEDQRIMAVNYAVKGDSFVAEKPRVWFGKALANLGLAVNFDLAPDGKRLIVLMPAESPEPRETRSHVTLVVNVFDEVRRRVAGQGR